MTRDNRSDALPAILGRIREYSAAFSEKAQTIVQALQSHSDLDCRFLGVRLSFSDFYRSRREQAQQK
jgi:gamma-tubulin complex component 3